jgi:uncharacterized protein with HEPN domain
MTGRDDSVYLQHILEAIAQIRTYTAGMDEPLFLANRLVQDGVIRQIEIIGEASKNLSPATRSLTSGIPWKDIAGMRDKLIHQYFGVDIPSVWATVDQDLPQLQEQVTILLQKLNPER